VTCNEVSFKLRVSTSLNGVMSTMHCVNL
jgi:hypothetical protein